MNKNMNDSNQYLDIVQAMLDGTYEQEGDIEVAVYNKEDKDTGTIVAEFAGATKEDISVNANLISLHGIAFTQITIVANYIAGEGLVRKESKTLLKIKPEITITSCKVENGLLIIKYNIIKN